MKIGSIRVGNKRKGAPKLAENEVAIDIDRANPILGNPYVLHDKDDDIERAHVLFKYGIKYQDDCQNGGPMLEETKKIARRVYKGENIVLQCWCHGPPTNKPCHGDFIKLKIEEILAPYMNL